MKNENPEEYKEYFAKYSRERRWRKRYPPEYFEVLKANYLLKKMTENNDTTTRLPRESD